MFTPSHRGESSPEVILKCRPLNDPDLADDYGAMVAEDRHAFWTVMLYTWPYICIPVAFSVDRKLRARWLLEDVSRPASGYRFRGANVRMVFTLRVKEAAKLQGTWSEGGRVHERSRWLECTNLWPLAVVIPALFVFAAEWSPDALAVLLVCTPFMFLAVFSLTLSQVGLIPVSYRERNFGTPCFRR